MQVIVYRKADDLSNELDRPLGGVRMERERSATVAVAIAHALET